MANHPLNPENVPAGRDRITQRGKGTGALGPSDSSDSGSDLKGAPGLDEASLEGDSDRSGTGERASAEPDAADAEGRDIDVDHVEEFDVDTEPEAEPGEGKPRRR